MKILTGTPVRFCLSLATLLLLTLSPHLAHAASCSYTNFNIGLEVVAKQGPNAAGEYRYDATIIRCSPTGQVIYDSGVGFPDPYDLGYQQPTNIVNSIKTTFGLGANSRIYINANNSTCPTHILTVNRFWPTGQTIDGIPITQPISATPYEGVFPNPVYLAIGAGLPACGGGGGSAGNDGDGGNLGICEPANPGSGLGSALAPLTDPINTGWRGNKYQREVDYTAGPFPLRFERNYNSRDAQIPGLTTGGATDVVGTWRHTYQRSIVTFSTGSKAAVYRPDGKIYVYRASGGNWVTDPHIVERLTQVTGGWQIVTSEDETETYDSTGKLTSIRNRAGLLQILAYDASNRLTSVTDPFGRSLTFTYSGNNIATVTDPVGGVYTHAYAANGNLTSVTYPDTKVRTYLYENTTFTKALTGITDENNVRFATWTYDAQGRATSSEHGASGSGIDRATVVYNANGSATVTDALNTARTYTYGTQFGVVKNTATSQPCTACGGSVAASTSYDANGFVSAKVDFNGNTTNYTYDARGLENSRTEAAGTALARTTTTTWHPSFRLPAQISEPNRSTAFTYDGAGNLTQKTVTSGAQSRTWATTYNGNGQALTVDGPRTDVSDVTTYAYDASANLASITNALGHVTNVTSYDAHGRPLSITDPNGLVTTLSYDARSRLTSRNASGEITTYTYDNAGQLTRVTLPNSAFLNYTFDAAHRLTDIQDQLGNKIHYTLDLLGNRTGESVTDPASVLTQTRSRVFDALSRLQKDIGGASPSTEITQYGYDGNGNLTTVTDPLSHITANAYDALNRLSQVTDPANGVTRYGYTALDQLASVTDPRNLATGYTQDGLGNVTQTTSPDTGVSTALYDAAGNITSRTDAKNQTTTYQYDALNRVTLETRADASTVTWTYDGGSNQLGRLTGITDGSGSTTWAYDLRGRVVQKTQTVGTTVLSTSYAYDATGQLVSVTYPSGNTINYAWTNGQISDVTLGTPPRPRSPPASPTNPSARPSPGASPTARTWRAVSTWTAA